jgi:hypothetical protein
VSPVVGEDLIVGDFVLGEGEGEPFAERLIQKMDPWITGDFELYLKAASAPYEKLEAILEEVGEQGQPGWLPPYGKILNPTTCPAAFLPWLAQFVGASVPEGATEEEARAIVLAESGLARGTLGSLEALLRKALGTTPFEILERTNPETAANEAYALTIIVPTGHLTNAVYEEAALTIPAGIVWGVIEREGTWFSGGKRWEELPAGKSWGTIKESEL